MSGPPYSLHHPSLSSAPTRSRAFLCAPSLYRASPVSIHILISARRHPASWFRTSDSLCDNNQSAARERACTACSYERTASFPKSRSASESAAVTNAVATNDPSYGYHSENEPSVSWIEREKASEASHQARIRLSPAYGFPSTSDA